MYELEECPKVEMQKNKDEKNLKFHEMKIKFSNYFCSSENSDGDVEIEVRKFL